MGIKSSISRLTIFLCTCFELSTAARRSRLITGAMLCHCKRVSLVDSQIKSCTLRSPPNFSRLNFFNAFTISQVTSRTLSLVSSIPRRMIALNGVSLPSAVARVSGNTDCELTTFSHYFARASTHLRSMGIRTRSEHTTERFIGSNAHTVHRVSRQSHHLIQHFRHELMIDRVP